MFIRRLCTLTFLLLLPLLLMAQIKPAVGIRQNTPQVHAFTNARIVIAPGKVIEKGTLVIRDGVIVASGANVAIPADARIWNLSGMTIYPGLIDSYSDIGMPKKPSGQGGDDQKKPEPASGPKHWNSSVLSSLAADELFQADQKTAEKLRGMGFTSALIVPQKGIFHGSSAVMNLGDDTPNKLLLRGKVAQHVGFDNSGSDDYPNSLMGAVALIRQTFYDAQWHKAVLATSAKNPSEPRPEFVEDLAALEPAVVAQQPVVFETTDELALMRAQRIADEFKLRLWARGSGYEYRQLDAVKKLNIPIILPINFPETPSVQTQEDALNVSLMDLRHWDAAPENPKMLQQAGIPFALTTSTLKDISTFPTNLRKTVERGLSKDAALAALTTTPARFYGLESKLGTLDAGKLANFIITDGDLFSEKTKVRETWIDGKRYEVKPKPESDIRGTWTLLLKQAPFDTLTLTLSGEADDLKGNVKAKGKEGKTSNLSYSSLRLSFAFESDSLGASGTIRMSGTMSGDKFIGSGELSNGSLFSWTGTMTEPMKQAADTSKPKEVLMTSFPAISPPGEFGRAKYPDQPAKVLVRGATIWTSGPQGKLDNADMLIEQGKITRVAQNISAPPDAVIIDGKGKHITPGLIDCHSHSAAVGSVNETGKAITSEVRIGDVVDPYDIAIYRELAGGLTAANILHGSANAIGGQNQVIKLRWGALPEAMKFEGAIPGIKFALGENPKQSNWGDKYTTRYPQTRGGVEQIIRDEFKAALDYERAQKEFTDGKRKMPVRRDLELDAIVEIIRGKRLVHSHSYRQDEILMLIRVADEFGFKIGTFQHVLEGYKVADAIAKHGAGASCFSDWWAYKFEVYDAIPYAGALMHNAGVVVSFNSDSDELARRMNLEAAKAVKYGGISETEALKFVTLNPAKQLKIDKRVGSLEAGKDADFAVWSGSPLSTYSVCEQTWIDGRKFFDREEDRHMNETIKQERAHLIQKSMGSKKLPVASGSPAVGGSPNFFEKDHYSCHDAH